MLGALALLVLLVVLVAAVVVSRAEPDEASRSGLPVVPPSSTTTTETGRSATSVAGTGPPTRISASSAAASLRSKQRAGTPDLTIGAISCPPGPYRVGQVVVCGMRLEDAEVFYRTTVTGPETLDFTATSPIVDTDKAEALMESKEPGTTADCGAPRVRQLDVGATLTCSSAASTWVFTVTPDGDLFGTKQ